MERLATDLSKRFGRGFSRRSIEQMRAFYLAWPIPQTPSAELAAQKSGRIQPGLTSRLTAISQAFPLPWSAYVRLLSVKDPSARLFYESEALRLGWSVRQLDRQIQSQLYERVRLSAHKGTSIGRSLDAEPQDRMTPEQVIHDPFILEFLDLHDRYSESDLEDALIQNLFDFLLELGDDYAFVGRQRRLRIDDTWFRVDLLFYHRSLRSLLLIDLMIGKFSYADAGQMHMYINYATEHWVKPGENAPVGLILCSSKGESEAHYALEGLQNRVLAAEYRTVLPNEQQLLAALRRSKDGTAPTSS